MDTLGQEIRQQRLAKGMSARELALRLGLSPSYICDLEFDRRSPSEKTVRALAQALNVGFDTLMALLGRFGDEAEEYLRRTPAAAELVRALASQRVSNGKVKKLVESVKEGSAE